MPSGPTPVSADAARIRALEARIAELEAALTLAHAQALSGEREARTAAEHAAERATLLSVATSILSSGPLDQGILARVADLLVPRFGERCLLDLAGPGLAPLRLRVRADGPDQRVSEPRPHGGPPLLFAGHPFAEALAAPGATILPALTPAQGRLLDAPERATCLCVPLRLRGQVIGLLALAASDPAHGYAPADRILADELGARIGQAIAQAQITSAWAQTAEARDNAFALLDTIFVTVPVGLGVLDADLRYIRVNQALADVDGLPVAAYPGRTPAELLPWLAPTLEPVLRQVLTSGVAVRDLDIHGLTEAAPDEPRDWLASYYPVRDAGAEVIGVGVVVVEVTERVRAQRAIERQADVLREQAALLDHAHVLVRDAESRIVAWNQGAERLYGWTAEEAVGRISHELFQTRFPISLEGAQAELFATGRWEGELAHTSRDGAELLVASHQVVFRDQTGRPLRVLEVNNDITALRRAERALRERDEQLRLAHDAAELGAWWRDLDTGVIHVDERAQAHFGLAAAEAPVAALLERVHPDDLPRWRQAVGQTLDPAGDGRATVEYRVVHPDGSVHWLAVHARAYFAGEGSTRRPVKSSGTSQNITARKREEEALRASEANLRTILESASQAFMLLDRELRVVQWNREAAAAVAAQSPLPLRAGTPAVAYVPATRAEERLALMRRALAGERVRVEGQTGTAPALRWMILEYVPVYDEGGQVVGICASGLDITEQRESRRALEYERQQLAAIVNTMHEGVVAIRPDRTLALINPAAVRLRGLDPAHPPTTLADLERTAHRLLDAQGRELVVGELPPHRVLRGECFASVEVCHHPGAHGEERWLLLNGTPVYDADGAILLGVLTFQDITQRKRDEAQLRQLAAMLDHAHVLIRDAESRIVFWNQGAERLYGWTTEEALGQVSHDLLQTRFPDPREEVQAQLFATGRWEGEVTHRRRDGSAIVVASLKILFRDASGAPTHILEVNNDVTALKRAEEALRERDEQLRLAYDAAELGIWRRDFTTELVQLDARAQAHYGFDRPEGPITEVLARAHPQDVAGARARVAAALEPASDGRYNAEYRMLHADGTAHWLSVCGRLFFAESAGARRLVLAIGTSQDITARKRIEQELLDSTAALRVSEERFRLLAEQAQDLIYRYRLAPEPGFEYVSPAATAITGYTPEEHYADPQLGFKLVEPEDRPLLAQIADGSVGAPLVLRWRRKDGRVIWTEQVNRLFVDEAGRPQAIEGIARDITARKAAEEQVRAALAAEQQARQAAERAAIYSSRLEAMATALSGALTRDAVAAVVLEHGSSVAGASAVVLALLDPTGEYVNVISAIGRDAAVIREFSARPISALPPLEQSIRAQEQLWLSSPEEAEARFPGTAAIMAKLGDQAKAALPLVTGGRTIGVISLSFAAATPFSLQERTLLTTLAQQCAQALDRARLYDEIVETRERLQQLSQRLLETQEQERRHLARELHDEVGQELTGLRLALELAAQLPVAERDGRLADAHRATRELIGKVRALSLDLRPAMLDDMGLLPALLWQLKRYGEQTGMTVDFRHRGLERRLPAVVETVAYRVVQEALTNIARHAGVSTATVSILASAERLQVQIRDEGRGFDLEEALAAGRSSGLPGMQERVSLLNGMFSIETAPGAGTCVTVRLPISEELQ